jgi:SAM-dependent methyltransferase
VANRAAVATHPALPPPACGEALTTGWEDVAEDWTRWARTPGHDVYRDFSGPALFELVPPPGRRTLDLGCGEGRVSRDLVARGHRVVGVDASPTLVRHAREADTEGEYVVADAASLPFADESFDLVVACNSLMDVEDMPTVVREIGRVVAPGGRLCVCITHPFRDAGRYESSEADAPLVIRGSYFGKRRFAATAVLAGREFDFRGWSYPVSMYMQAIGDAGFLVETMREPPDPRRAVPNFLQLRAVRRRTEAAASQSRPPTPPPPGRSGRRPDP